MSWIKTLNERLMREKQEIDARKCMRITSYIYSQVCEVVGYSHNTLEYFYRDGEMPKHKYDNYKSKIDEMYIQRVTSLSTDILNKILELHKASELIRAPETIEAITHELFTRVLQNEKD